MFFLGERFMIERFKKNYLNTYSPKQFVEVAISNKISISNFMHEVFFYELLGSSKIFFFDIHIELIRELYSFRIRTD